MVHHPSPAIGDEAYSAFQVGCNPDVDATAEQMTATSVHAGKGVKVKASPGNTGIVYVGTDSTVTAGSSLATDGYPLSAGDEMAIPVHDPSFIYVIASTANQAIHWYLI